MLNNSVESLQCTGEVKWRIAAPAAVPQWLTHANTKAEHFMAHLSRLCSIWLVNYNQPPSETSQHTFTLQNNSSDGYLRLGLRRVNLTVKGTDVCTRGIVQYWPTFYDCRSRYLQGLQHPQYYIHRYNEIHNPMSNTEKYINKPIKCETIKLNALFIHYFTVLIGRWSAEGGNLVNEHTALYLHIRVCWFYTPLDTFTKVVSIKWMNRQRHKRHERKSLQRPWWHAVWTLAGSPTPSHVCLFRLALSFRYSRKEVCTPALNQIPSYLPLEAGCDHRGQLSRLSGPAEGNTDRVNPMGHDWSLDSLAIRLMTGQHSFSPLWPSDRHVDKTCKEGQQLSVAFSPTFLI